MCRGIDLLVQMALLQGQGPLSGLIENYLLGDLEQEKVEMIVKEIASYRLLYARSSRTADAKCSLTVCVCVCGVY